MESKKIYDHKKIVELIKDGKDRHEICSIIGCNQQTVKYVADKFDLKLKRKSIVFTPDGLKKRVSRMTGNNNPFYGKKHSTDTRKRMSENHADFTGDNNPFKKSLRDPIKHQEHKLRCQHIWDNRDKEWRKNFSEKLSDSIVSSDKFKESYFHKHHKAQHLITKKAGKIFCRSSWEVYVALFLDECDSVVSFTVESLKIPYYINEIETRYTKPDFLISLINNNKLLIEVKPISLLEYNNNHKKINAYKNYCKENIIQFSLFDLTQSNINEIITNATQGLLYVDS